MNMTKTANTETKIARKVLLSDGSFYTEHNIEYLGFRYSEGLFGNTLIDPYGNLVHIFGMAPKDWESAKKYIEAH